VGACVSEPRLTPCGRNRKSSSYWRNSRLTLCRPCSAVVSPNSCRRANGHDGEPLTHALNRGVPRLPVHSTLRWTHDVRWPNPEASFVKSVAQRRVVFFKVFMRANVIASCAPRHTIPIGTNHFR
jgi:hypothetical protein